MCQIGCWHEQFLLEQKRFQNIGFNGLDFDSHNTFVGIDRFWIRSSLQMSVDSRLRSKIPGVICKLDIKNTYDHVNWEALIYLLGKMRFGDKLC